MTPVNEGEADGSIQAARIYRTLRAQIVGGQLPPDEKLKINQLAKQFDVSPGAVREGLSRLISEHLVVGLDQRGFRVAPLSRDDVYSLFTTRSYIEPEVFAESVRDGDAAWEAAVRDAYFRLQDEHEKVRRGERPERMDAARHENFHRALLGGCKNSWSLRVFDLLYNSCKRYRNLAVHITTIHRNVEVEHTGLFVVALERNADEARRRIREHTLLTRDLICGFIDAGNAVSQALDTTKVVPLRQS